MKWLEDLRLPWKICVLVMTAIVFGYLIRQLVVAGRQIASSGWPSAAGEVQRTVAKPWMSDSWSRLGGHRRVEKFYGRVQYRYMVDGKVYTSDLTDLGPGLKRANAATALGDVAQYHPGMGVTVYYDPSDPSIGILEKGIPAIHGWAMIVLAIGISVGSVFSFFIVRGWWRNAQESRRRREAREMKRRGSRGVPRRRTTD